MVVGFCAVFSSSFCNVFFSSPQDSFFIFDSCCVLHFQIRHRQLLGNFKSPSCVVAIQAVLDFLRLFSNPLVSCFCHCISGFSISPSVLLKFRCSRLSFSLLFPAIVAASTSAVIHFFLGRFALPRLSSTTSSTTW